MPNHIAALKHMRQTEKRTAVNRRNKGVLRASIRTLRRILAQGELEKAQQLIPQTLSRIDKSAQKGVIHKNTAGRIKSRLTARLHQLARAKQPQSSS